MLSAYIALGSNMGNRAANLQRSRIQLQALGCIDAASDIYETPALMPENAPESWNVEYLNQVVALRTPLTDPHALLAALKAIEAAMGRIVSDRWAPRVIDLDILTCEDAICASDGLTLPHPSMHLRDFVLKPLCDIAPDFCFPSAHVYAGKSARDILRQLPSGNLKLWQGSATQIMGIVNITPDSFSGDGEARNPHAAIEKIMRFAEEGADCVDVGAQSTRPGASILSAQEEWQRLSPVLEALHADMVSGKLRISVDTFYPQVAAQALAVGVRTINDVGGLSNPAMREVLAASSCDIISMHSLTLPTDKAVTLPKDTDISQWLKNWHTAQMKVAQEAGIASGRITFDPGLGFGKTASQSMRILHAFMAKNEANAQWLIGHSRKSFLQFFEDTEAAKRDALTLSISAPLMLSNVGYLRVHNVKAHVTLRQELS